MAAARKKGEDKTPKNFRLTGTAISLLDEMTSFFDESQTDTVERAIVFLSENRKQALKQEFDKKNNQA